MLKNKLLSAMGGAPANYIEDVFSTWLYTGNGSTQTINNGIDLAGKGGLVWARLRTTTNNHNLFDTSRGQRSILWSNLNFANYTAAVNQISFNTNGFSFLTSGDDAVNANGFAGVSWTFRKQPKFFDVVTYTGDGTTPRSIAHNLGSTAACVMVKRTDTTGNWKVLFTGLTRLCLNSTEAEMGTLTVQGGYIDNANATTFTLVSNAGSVAEVNASGGTYVAYVFASNAGGFGLSGTDNVISCGSYSGSGAAGNPVTLGYEPQWVMTKRVDSTGDWNMQDVMRGMPVGSNMQLLRANTSGAESDVGSPMILPNATGFSFNSGSAGWNGSGADYIYIAIRRGPMRTPTTGTSVFAPIAATASAGTNRTVGFPADLTLSQIRDPEGGGQGGCYVQDRLRGYEVGTTSARTLRTFSADAEVAINNWDTVYEVWNRTARDGEYPSGYTNVWWHLRRAPNFMDEVCYTGAYNGSSAQTVNHNLGVSPELMIFKRRSRTGDWWSILPSALGLTKFLQLNSTAEQDTFPLLSSVSSSAFAIGTGSDTLNESGSTYVAYLFASCPGVSKVGSYTGTGATQVINCGFTSGARYVLIKSTSTTGNWLVWDTARGMIPSNDPYLALNSTAAEVTGTDLVDTAATGFELSNAGGNLANSNGVSYIFLAIA